MFPTTVRSLPVTAVEIADLTKKDKVLVKLYEYTSSGWPNHCPDSVHVLAYFTVRAPGGE